jgi:hypothetical protein
MYGTLTRKFSLPQLTSRDCGNWYQPLCGFYGTVLLRMRWWHRQAEKCLWSGGGYQENSCARRDVGADIARCCWPVWPAGNGACSSAGEHYVDIVGVTGSIPVTPTISFSGKLVSVEALATSRGIAGLVVAHTLRRWRAALHDAGG